MSALSMTTPTTTAESALTATSHTTFDFTPPGAGPKPTTTNAAGDMSGGMGMSSNMGGMMEDGCKISMLWNWNTVGACFLSRDWRITSSGAFAGLCIGVILLVILLELLRRVSKTYDRHLVEKHQKTVRLASSNSHGSSETANGSLIAKGHHFVPAAAAAVRPNVYQQAVRALLHTLQFALAYWIMLLAMYYNGYIIICIIIGAFMGSFIFQWERIGDRSEGEEVGGGAAQEPTGCCG